MAILKKYWFVISCGVVAILAVVAIFWPIGGMYETLRHELDAHAQVGAQMGTVLNTSRTMPMLGPDETAPATLDVFPTPDVAKAASDAIDRLGAAAKDTLDLGVKINGDSHILLVDGCLPDPSPDLSYAFAQKYEAETMGDDGKTQYARWQKILNSTALPTAQEIIDAQNALQVECDKRHLIIPPGQTTPTPESQQASQQEFQQLSPGVPRQLQSERGAKFTCYLEPNAITLDPNISTQGQHANPVPGDIFDAQLQIWMLDDVTNAVARCNKRYSDPDSGGLPREDVLHSAIKNVELISNPVAVMSTNPGDQTTGVGGPPVTAGQPAPAGPAAYVPAVTSSGRVSNGLYDTVQFEVKLVVDAGKIPLVIRELEAGQFITVLYPKQITVLDQAITANTGYRYGSKPVVEIDLQCEELYLRQWTLPWLPPTRQQGLGGIGATPGANPAAQPAAQ